MFIFNMCQLDTYAPFSGSPPRAPALGCFAFAAAAGEQPPPADLQQTCPVPCCPFLIRWLINRRVTMIDGIPNGPSILTKTTWLFRSVQNRMYEFNHHSIKLVGIQQDTQAILQALNGLYVNHGQCLFDNGQVIALPIRLQRSLNLLFGT